MGSRAQAEGLALERHRDRPQRLDGRGTEDRGAWFHFGLHSNSKRKGHPMFPDEVQR